MDVQIKILKTEQTTKALRFPVSMFTDIFGKKEDPLLLTLFAPRQILISQFQYTEQLENQVGALCSSFGVDKHAVNHDVMYPRQGKLLFSRKKIQSVGAKENDAILVVSPKEPQLNPSLVLLFADLTPLVPRQVSDFLQRKTAH